MAGARTEKIGSVYTRVKALLDKGVMKPQNKPIWFEVYEAFPPRVEPKYFRPVDPRLPVDIVYKEDLIRARFYKDFPNVDLVNLFSTRSSLSQRLVAEYKELESSSPELSEDELYQQTLLRLTSLGYLRQLKDKVQAKGGAGDLTTEEGAEKQSSTDPSTDPTTGSDDVKT